MQQPRRIMLIAWRWKDLLPACIQKSDLDHYSRAQLEEWRGTRFDEYRVGVRREASRDHQLKDDLVVRVCVAKEAGPHAGAFLSDLAAWYQQQPSVIYLFLHRNDGFDSTTVSELYRQPAVDKCFLFSDGRDFIYFATQEVGLIDDSGRFFVGRAEVDKPSIEVADTRAKVVFKTYFDRTWAYYSQEYDTKILELKEDLLAYYLYKLDDLDRAVSHDYWRQLLKANRNLYLRVKSLITDHHLYKNEIAQFQQLEKKRQKSYAFDDFRSYVEERKLAGQPYRLLLASLADMVSEQSSNGHMVDSPRTHLWAWQEHFQQLSSLLSSTQSRVP